MHCFMRAIYMNKINRGETEGGEEYVGERRCRIGGGG